MADIKRYGLQWNGPDKFVCTEMPDGLWVSYSDHLAAIKAAVAAEREACALIADQGMRASPTTKAKEYAALIARAIRARGAAHE